MLFIESSIQEIRDGVLMNVGIGRLYHSNGCLLVADAKGKLLNELSGETARVTFP